MNRYSPMRDKYVANIRSKILACMKRGTSLVKEMAAHTGLSASLITSHLMSLEQAGQVHREHGKKTGLGYYCIAWKIGPSTGPLPPRKKDHGRSCDKPNIVVLKDYPTVGKRDPLVAALFGAPKQSAPVCTACKVEQGKGHLSGCVVALVAA
jgi:hypothetical protein